MTLSIDSEDSEDPEDSERENKNEEIDTEINDSIPVGDELEQQPKQSE